MNHFRDVPTWVKSAVFYQIFPDRFARSPHWQGPGRYLPWNATPTAHGFMGGNLRGIAEALPHIASLGCNALYLCPVFASSANHRYHTSDYFLIDPVLGDLAEFDNLIAECKRYHIRIILDGVFNHCSRGSYQFASLLEEGAQSPFVDWFHVKGWPLNAYAKAKPNYECWWGLPALPKWNTGNPQVREFLFSVAEYWTRRGIDGWRLDVPNEINDDSFWQEFRRRVRAVQPEAYIVGEIWDDPSRWLQGDQFDGVMHYPARKAILRFLFPGAATSGTGGPGDPDSKGLSAREFCAQLSACHPEHRFGFPLGLLGSHDNPRIASLAKHFPERLPAAWAMLFFLPAAPCIYYGDELELLGEKDPDNRRCFPWDHFPSASIDHRGDYVPPSGVSLDWPGERSEFLPTLCWLQFLTGLRKDYPLLGHGAIHVEVVDGGIRVERHLQGAKLILVVALPGIVRMELPSHCRLLHLHHGVCEGQRLELQQNGLAIYEG